mmetsp:Transcript_26419/g.67476  ORF Transcript_26419/g.67476 Transcript_26419/m.67476 type:complete len:449 (-) Transcript_26419:570-1916(-)
MRVREMWTERILFFSFLLFACVQHSHASFFPRSRRHPPNYYPSYTSSSPSHWQYHDLAGVEAFILNIAKKNADIVELSDVTKTRENQPVYYLIVTDPSTPASKKREVFMTAGEHAREFIPVESVLYLLHTLVSGWKAGEGTKEREFSKFVLTNFILHIVPMLSPSGRAELERKKDYCQRGTRSGVDLNRNFPWNYGGPGSSSHRHSEEYRGVKPISEPESQLIDSIAQHNHLIAYLSLHSGARTIFLPYSDTESKRKRVEHPNTLRMMALAGRISEATSGFFTEYGICYEKNDYTADGTAMDYLAGVLNVPFSYTFEMYGDLELGDLDNCFAQFNPNNGDELDKTLSKLHQVYTTIFEFLVGEKNTKEDVSEAVDQEETTTLSTHSSTTSSSSSSSKPSSKPSSKSTGVRALLLLFTIVQPPHCLQIVFNARAPTRDSAIHTAAGRHL